MKMTTQLTRPYIQGLQRAILFKIPTLAQVFPVNFASFLWDTLFTENLQVQLTASCTLTLCFETDHENICSITVQG